MSDDLTNAARRLDQAQRANANAVTRMNNVIQNRADDTADSKRIDTLNELAAFLEAYARHTIAMVEALDRQGLKAKEKSL